MAAKRLICLGLFHAVLAYDQTVPLKKKWHPFASDDSPLNSLVQQFRPLKKKLQPPPICAAPLLEFEPTVNGTMRVVKPPTPLPRMPELVPPAPACRDNGDERPPTGKFRFTDARVTR